MIQLYIDNGQGEVDYTEFLINFKIQDSINQPAICTIQVGNTRNFFQPPVRSGYVRLFSRKYNRNLFTGFIGQTPVRAFLGVRGNAAPLNQRGDESAFTYSLTCTSDEWLLQVKQISFIPAMVNQTMGQILINLANVLAPGFFDTQNVDGGDIVPIFIYDPTKTWAETAKGFADALRFRYKVINRAIYFKPYGDAAFGISYDETNRQSAFDPYSLNTTILNTTVINDVIVIGDTEGGNIHWDYFIGDGVTGNFPLKHSVYLGYTNILLQDDWSENAFNTQYWKVFDAQQYFALQDSSGNAVGALNVIGGPQVDGIDYIVGVNGFEIGGDLNLQHGEVTFIDKCTGKIGNLYSGYQSTDPADPNYYVLPNSKLLSGFNLTTDPGTFVLSSSGCAGIVIQPILNGLAVGPQYTSKLNNRYQIQTYVNSSKPIRYNRIFRTILGQPYGGDFLAAQAQITYVITEVPVVPLVDPTHPALDPTLSKVVMQYTTIAEMPSFCLYAPVVNYNLNLVISGTLVARPPQGRLLITGGSAQGPGIPFLINPPYFSLPIVDPSDTLINVSSFPASGHIGTPVPYALGFGFNYQAATIGQAATQIQGQTPQTLQFYSDSLPGVGVRVALRTWEAEKSVARVFDRSLVIQEAKVQGDDGRRSAIVTNLNPLPRTSEECELAAKAMIADKGFPQYNGSYSVPSPRYFDGNTTDYPYTGRYFDCTAPSRNIDENFLVSQVTTTMVELYDEILQFDIQFGHDQIITKLLKRFITPTQNALTTQDAAVAPTPQELNELGVTYLQNLENAQVTQITGSQVTIDVGMMPASGQLVEIRRNDVGWGYNSSSLVLRTAAKTIQLARSAFEQIYFMRLVGKRAAQLNIGVPAVTGVIPAFSRRSTQLRVFCPLVPTAPSGHITFGGAAGIDPVHPIIHLNLTGDIRNIYGVEIRNTDNSTIWFQEIFNGTVDFIFDNTTLKARSLFFNAYFFNLFGEYSPAGVITGSVPVPPAPVLDEVETEDVNGTLIMIKIDILSNRSDIRSITVQVDDVNTFDSPNLQVVPNTTGQPGSVQIRAINALGKFIRAKRTDFFGDSAWSNIISPSQQLLQSSDYLKGQLSLLPNTTGVPIGLFSYNVTSTVMGGVPQAHFLWTWPSFNVTFPMYADPTNIDPATGLNLGSQILLNVGASPASGAAPQKIDPNTGLLIDASNIGYTGLPGVYKFYAYIQNAYAAIINGKSIGDPALNAIVPLPQVVIVISSVAAPLNEPGTGDDPNLLARMRADGNTPLTITSMSASAPSYPGPGMSGSDGGLE